MVNAIKLAIILSASLRGVTAFSNAEGKMRRLGAAAKAVGAIVSAFAIAGIVNFASQMVAAFAEFEFQMVRVGAILNATGAEMDKLTAKAIRLGESTVFTATEASSAMFQLAQSGLDVNEVLGATEVVLGLAQVGLIDMARSAELTTDIMRAMNLQVEDLEFIGDQLTFTMTNTNTTIEQLATAFGIAAPVASALNVGMSELSAIFGVLADRGQKASVAGTAVRRMLTTLLSPSKVAQDALNRLNVTAFNTDGSFRGLIDIIGQFAATQAATGDITRDLGDIFTDRALPAVLNLVAAFDEGETSLVSLNAALAGGAAEGELERIVKKQELTLDFTLKQIKAIFNTILIELGEGLKPLFKLFVEFFENNKQGFVAFGKLIMALFTAFAPLIPVFLLITQAILIWAKFLEPLVSFIAPLVPLLIVIWKWSKLIAIASVLAATPWVGWLIVITLVLAALNKVFDITAALSGPGAAGRGFLGGIGSVAQGFLGFQRGTDFVPESGFFFLHKGEQVRPASAAGVGGQRQSMVTGNERESTRVINQNVTVNAVDPDEIAAALANKIFGSLEKMRYV